MVGAGGVTAPLLHDEIADTVAKVRATAGREVFTSRVMSE